MGFGVEAARLTDGSGLVRVSGEFDMAAAPAFDAAVGGVEPINRLLVDLTEAAFLDSSGVRAVVVAARSRSLPFAVVCPPANERIRRVLDFFAPGDALTVLDAVDQLPA